LIDHRRGTVEHLNLESHGVATSFDQKADGAGDRMARDRQQRDAPLGRFRDAHLHVATNGNLERQRLAFFDARRAVRIGLERDRRR